MNLPLNIASRYLFARKLSLVNIISAISMIGVAGMTAALIIILSIFNGFDSLITSMINQFDPDIKITSDHGKTFVMDSSMCSLIKALDGVVEMSLCVEETVLLKYDDYQHIATIKGVDDSYASICDIAPSVYLGKYQLRDSSGVPFMVLGADVASFLWVQINSLRPIAIYAPLRGSKVTLNPEEAFSRAYVMPSGVFHIHQDFDAKYAIVPIDFAREMLGYDDGEVSHVEIKVSAPEKVLHIQEALMRILGESYNVKNRYQQQDILYKVMQSEKLSIFVMLTFIIVIASFNIIGALTMLIIDKKRDIQILSHLGATQDFVRRIFLRTGQLITATGALAGLVFGLLICWAQIQFEFIKFPEGSYIIDSYPVEVRSWDVVATFVVVVLIGFLASIIPTRKINV